MKLSTLGRALGLLALAACAAGAQTTITGTQDYSNGSPPPAGTLIFEGGTLVTNGTLDASNAISMTGAGTIDADGNDSNFSGAISGSGPQLTLTDSVGGGLITLSGSSTNSGVTVVQGVTAGVGNSSAFGTGVIELSGGTLQAETASLNVANAVFLNGSGNILDPNGQAAFTLSGPIFGNGSLSINSSGMVLDGSNYYSGGTTIGSGVGLDLGGSSSLGTGLATLAGGNTFKLVAQGAGLANPLLLNGDLTVDVAGNTGAFSGTLTGAGNLTVTDSAGGGLLQLSGVGGSWGGNIASGGTTVGDGTHAVTLQMGNAGVMPTAGFLTTNADAVFDMNGFAQTVGAVTNNGTIKTGAATLTAASYSGGGILNVVPQLSAPSLLVDGGNATLSGTTLEPSGHPVSGTYEIVETENGGTLTGTFSSINLSLLPGYTDSIVSCGLDEFCMTLSAPSFVHAGQTGNEANIASALNNEYGASSDMTGVLGLLEAMTPGQLSQALDQMSPIAFTAMRGMAFAGSGLQSAAITRRVADLRGSDENVVAPPSESARAVSPYPGVLVADAGGAGTAEADDEDEEQAQPEELGWGLFFSGLDTRGRLDGINGAAGFQPGYDFNAWGATMGADYRFDANFAAGFTAGYLEGSSTLDSGIGQIVNHSIRFGTYGTGWSKAWHTDYYLGGALDSFDTTRNIDFPGLYRTATASPDGEELNAAVSSGYDLKSKAGTLTPYASLSYDMLLVNSFGENGAGALDLDMRSQTAESLRPSLGARYARKFTADWFSFEPSLGAGWERELVNQSRSISAQFSTGQGSFGVSTADVARNALVSDANLLFGFTDYVSLRLGYSLDLRSDFDARTADATLRVRF